MVNAAFHCLSWGLVATLVYLLFSAPEPVPVGNYVAMAELDQHSFIVAQAPVAPAQSTSYGLLRYMSGSAAYRKLQLEDWEGALAATVIGMCAVKSYPGEVMVLVQGPEAARLVHLQLRRWTKTPKSAVLTQAVLPKNQYSALACGVANDQTMSVLLYSHNAGAGTVAAAEYDFKQGKLQLGARRQLGSQKVVSAYIDSENTGVWEVERFPAGSRISHRDFAEQSPLEVFRLDGFQVVAVAAGAKPNSLSVVTADGALGGVWRMLQRD